MRTRSNITAADFHAAREHLARFGGLFLSVTRLFLPCRAIRAILRLSVGKDASDELRRFR